MVIQGLEQKNNSCLFFFVLLSGHLELACVWPFSPHLLRVIGSLIIFFPLALVGIASSIGAVALPHSTSLAPFFLWPPSRHPFNLGFLHLPIFPLARGAPTTNGNSTWGHCDLSVLGALFGLLKKQFFWCVLVCILVPGATACRCQHPTLLPLQCFPLFQMLLCARTWNDTFLTLWSV